MPTTSRQSLRFLQWFAPGHLFFGLHRTNDPIWLWGALGMVREQSASSRLWTVTVWFLAIFFIANLLLMIGAVVTNSLGSRWFDTWLPEDFTTNWFTTSWNEFQLGRVLLLTFQVAGLVVLLAGLLGLPAAYVMVRREFPAKRIVLFLFLLPLFVPPITYGIPLATVLYQAGLAGKFWGVVLANLVPAVPFVIMAMIPFIEQLDSRIEDAARTLGASPVQLFIHVLVPLLLPGVLAALLLVLVHTISLFELTFLTAGPDSQTLVLTLYFAMFSTGIRSSQSIDAMAVIYMISSLLWLFVALYFVSPTQMVTRAHRYKTQEL